MQTEDLLKDSYCNPLAIPAIPVGRGTRNSDYTGPWWREFGDPTVIKFKGKWYLFPSCGMVWCSDNMRDWTFHAINLYDVGWAPSVIERNGTLYLTASWEGTKIWATEDPLGEWRCLGAVTDEKGDSLNWCDPMLFVDDDGALYSYFSVGPNQGIFGVRMCDDEVTRFAAAPTNCFAFQPEHVWERFGEFNQDPSISHLEGAFMTKHDGRYYLQYSAAGAEWRNYAVGCYVGETALGPFHYQDRNPILIHKGGLLNGCGHHAVVEGPDGGLWCFYTILMRRFRGLERRIAMDPVRFDAKGEMFVDGPSERPRFMDGEYPEGVLPLACGQPASASSSAPAHEPECAVDNTIRTWWEADSCQTPQHLEVKLGAQYKAMAARILFNERLTPRNVAKAQFQYLIEGAVGEGGWQILCDCRSSEFDGHIRYNTWPEILVDKVRITITAAPEGSPPGIIDFGLFGTFHTGAKH
jgi:hypothetical protein